MDKCLSQSLTGHSIDRIDFLPVCSDVGRASFVVFCPDCISPSSDADLVPVGHSVDRCRRGVHGADVAEFIDSYISCKPCLVLGISCPGPHLSGTHELPENDVKRQSGRIVHDYGHLCVVIACPAVVNQCQDSLRNFEFEFSHFLHADVRLNGVKCDAPGV